MHTVLRARIIFLKKVHPAKRARAQELYIVSSYTYAFDETFTCVWMRMAGGTFIRWIYPDNLPPPPPGYSNDRNVLQACLSLAGEPGPDWAICGGGTGVIFFCTGCFWYHYLFLKIIISLVKTVYLCFYIFTPMCHISDCHVQRVYVCTKEFINWIAVAVTNKFINSVVHTYTRWMTIRDMTHRCENVKTQVNSFN
jgi:hypothetical protein